MIDFSGFKEFERTSRESFIQLWQHAHRIKGSIEISFQDPETGEDIYLVNDNGKKDVYGFPKIDTSLRQFVCVARFKFKIGEQSYEVPLPFGILPNILVIESENHKINAVFLFSKIAECFPGAVLTDEEDEA